MDAGSGEGKTPGEPWRHAAPYRGLLAMTKADTDFFFGRGRETGEVITTLQAGPDKLPPDLDIACRSLLRRSEGGRHKTQSIINSIRLCPNVGSEIRNTPCNHFH
jgi:hypothetical protein